MYQNVLLAENICLKECYGRKQEAAEILKLDI